MKILFTSLILGLTLSSFAQELDTFQVSNINKLDKNGFYFIELPLFRLTISGEFSNDSYIKEWKIHENTKLVKTILYSSKGVLLSRNIYHQSGDLKEKDSLVYSKDNKVSLITKYYDKNQDEYKVDYFDLKDNCDLKRFDFLKESEFYRDIKELRVTVVKSIFMKRGSKLIRESRIIYVNGVSFRFVRFILEKKRKSYVLMEIDENRNIYLKVKFKRLKSILLNFGLYDELSILIFNNKKLPNHMQID